MMNGDPKPDDMRKRTVGGGILKVFSVGDSEVHPWDEDREKVFRKDLAVAEEWVATFPVEPDLYDKSVVEIGCGFGALCVVASRFGARSVLGVELEESGAETARSLVAENFPDLRKRVEFTDYRSIESREMDEQFDVVLSQNCFEHYARPEEVLKRMIALLRPGGMLYSGFGPLWESPFGSHLSSICRLPWAHLWAGEQLISEHNRVRAHDQKDSWEALGLNQAGLPRYRRMFRQLDNCRLLHFCRNRTIRRRSRFLFVVLEIMSMLPFLDRYLTVSLFVIVQKGKIASVRDREVGVALQRKGTSGRAGGRVVVEPT